MRVPVWVLLGGLALYCATVAPTVLWGDDAELQRIVVTGEQRTIGQSGEASHLLWLGFARAFLQLTSWLPLDAAWRTNLVSAFFGAAALPFVYGAAVELVRPYGSRPQVAGLAAAGGLALSHTFWLFSARPDAYTLQTALQACAVWALLRWRRLGGVWLLAVAGGAVALALLNHVMILASGFGLAALALLVPGERRRALLLPALAAGALAATLLAAAGAAGVPLGELPRAVLSYRVSVPSWREAVSIPAYLLYQFPLSLALGLVGAVWLARRDRGLFAALVLLYLGNVLLVLGRLASVRDDFIFFLPSYLAVALLIGIGAAALPRVSPLVVGAIIMAPILVYPVASATAGALASRFTAARQLPGRDPVAYYLLPPKPAYFGARRYADDTFAALEPGAVVVSDWLPYQTLLYVQQVEGKRPDVRLEMINAGNDAQLSFLLAQARGSGAPPPLYLADISPLPYYEIEQIRRCFDIAPSGPVFRLTLRGGCG